MIVVYSPPTLHPSAHTYKALKLGEIIPVHALEFGVVLVFVQTRDVYKRVHIYIYVLENAHVERDRKIIFVLRFE